MSLTDTERNIVRKVIAMFLTFRQSTPRNVLLDEFEDPGALNSLDSLRVLDAQANRSVFLPTVLAFQYCGDSFLEPAKNSVGVVIRGLKFLFRASNFDTNLTHTPEDLHACLAGHNSVPEPGEISLGLFLAREFGVLQGFSNPKLSELATFQISEHVLAFKSVEAEWAEHVRQRGGRVDDARFTRIEEIIPMQSDSRKVFLVHGHDDAVKQSVARFLEKLDLEPIILHEQPNKGQTVIEKFETNSDVRFAVVLLTPDDEGRATTARDLKPRARQNVILELGYFIGKLHRARVCALHKDAVELPSDIHGVTWVRYDDAGGWRLELARELKAAGVSVDMNRA
jgi:predicted nucleotide-binding protein